MTRVPRRCSVPLVATAAALAMVACSAAAQPVPTPIGAGPLFRPRAAVRTGAAVGRLRCGRGQPRFGVHVEVFARDRVVIVPPGIGVAVPFRRSGAYVYPGGCSYPLRTLEPTGVVEVEASRRLVLGDLFRLWGQPLSATRLAGFRTTGSRPVRAYVGGKRRRGALRAIPLRRHAEIVLEVGPYVPPHRSFAFRPGL